MRLDIPVRAASVNSIASELMKGRKRGRPGRQQRDDKLQNESAQESKDIEERKKLIEELKLKKAVRVKSLNRPGIRVCSVVSDSKSKQLVSNNNLLAQHVSEIEWKRALAKINAGIYKAGVNDDKDKADSVRTNSTSCTMEMLKNSESVTDNNILAIRPLDRDVSYTADCINTDSDLDCNIDKRKTIRGNHSSKHEVSINTNEQSDSPETDNEEENDFDESEERSSNSENPSSVSEINSPLMTTNDIHSNKSNDSEDNSHEECSDNERESCAKILCEISEGKRTLHKHKESLLHASCETISEEIETLRVKKNKDTNIESNSKDCYNKNSDKTMRISSIQFRYKDKIDTVNLPKVISKTVSVNTDIQDDLMTKPNLTVSKKAKIHSRDNAEVCFAQVGRSAKIWTQEHPQIRGIYLNKGKREVKRNIVTLKRLPTAVDKGSYLRNGKVNDKNRIDDGFVFTSEGQRRRDLFEEGKVRDEYVVNWYMWCPGHGNCKRKCGGFGKCVEGMLVDFKFH